MLALNFYLALDQLRADPRFVFLTAFGVVIGTAVLVAAIGVAAMAQERLRLIKEEIGTQVLFLAAGTSDVADFHRKKGRLIDEQALSVLGTTSGRFTLQATYLRGSVMLDDQGVQRDASVLGFDPDDFSELAMALASGRLASVDDCYLDVASVPLTSRRTLRLSGSRCVLGGTFRQAGFLRSILNGESGSVVVTSFDKAYAVMGGQTALPTLAITLRLGSEADAFPALAEVGQFMQLRYPNLQFSLDWPGSRLIPLNQLLDQVRLVAVLVGALIMLISTVAMVNAMLAQIGQRRREFGIRLAIGATPQDLILQTLFEVLGIFGGGMLIGFGIAISIMYLWCQFSGWAFTLSPSLFLLSAGVTLVCALCSGLYPALKAAAIQPIKAMQDI
ncbi:ABC transporter permease [Pseudomonas turukhanskensis]|nr:ABC transporter permease [Pseudomonas turukhanskensis]